MPEEIGFPPGKTKQDYFPINGGFPPYQGWYWPDDFTENDRLWFWASTSGDSSYEAMSAYNTVASYNTGDQGKAGMGKDVESFQRQAAMYSVVDDDTPVANWPARTITENGYMENGVEVQGHFADGWFYPADHSPAEMVPPDWAG